MDLWAPSPSPIALFLLGLDERGADGVVEVGERQLVLRRGRVIDVRRTEGDPSLHEFLHKSGRVDDGGLEALRRGSADPDKLPADSNVLSVDALSETMRALWLDRLVRGITKAEAEGRAVPALGPNAVPQITAIEVALVPLVLDALERRAAEGDAEQVGSRATHRLDWREGPHLARARRWAGIDGKNELRIGALLTSAPAAASRIAALVRAGLARIVPPGTSAPAPARRLISISAPTIAEHSTRIPTAPLPPSRPEMPYTSQGESTLRERLTPDPIRHEAPPRGGTLPPPEPIRAPALGPGLLPPAPLDAVLPSRPSTLPPPRAPEVQLSPGAAQIFEHIGELASPLVELPQIVSKLEDPLDAIEREIAILEESTARAEERATAWRSAAETWFDRYGSVEERERALREAAAATPEDANALLDAANACTASARTELALAYGRAAVAAALEGDERDRVLQSYAELCLRAGRPSIALAALSSISERSRSSVDAHRIAASIHKARGRFAEAAAELCDSSALCAELDPVRATFDLRSAWCLALLSEEPFERLVHALVHEELMVGAMGLCADHAARSTNVEIRRTCWLAAAERAHTADRPLWAADFLLRAFDDEPSLESVYLPLDAALSEASAVLERTVVLEEIATAAPMSSRSEWMNRAADARLDVPGDGMWELELRLRCLELTPENEHAMISVRRQSEATADPLLLADSLERVARAKTWSSAEAQKAVLEELATITDELTNEPLRAAWARSMAASITGDSSRVRGRLAPSTRPIMQRAAELDRLSREGEAQEARRAKLELASILAQDPERRDRAIALLKELLEEAWDSTASGLLERLFAIRGDVDARIAVLHQRARSELERAPRTRALLWIASLEAARGDHREAAHACSKILEEVPSHQEALIRLRRAASRLSDHALLTEALEREAQLELPAASRARLYSFLATSADATHDAAKAVTNAAMALENDAHAGAAAWILARHVTSDSPVSGLAIECALASIGEVPSLLWAQLREAETEEARSRIAERWSELAPTDAAPWMATLRIASERGETDLAERALRELLLETRADIAHIAPIEEALVSLASRGELERATVLALAAMDRYGEAALRLRELASGSTEQANMPRLRTSVLERLLTASTEAEAIACLWMIANHHQAQGDQAGEARALLRVLARAPRDGAAIERLANIYARTGEHERWMAVLALRVSEAAGEAERFEGWLALSAATFAVSNDAERALAFARSAIADVSSVHTDEEAERVLRVSSLLVSIGCTSDAVALLIDHMERADEAPAGKLAERAAAVLVRELGELRRALDVTVSGVMRSPRYKPLLLAAEHLALELGDVESAERVYLELIERAMGANGKRALLYRRARFLERAGHDAAALEAYLEAAAHSASSGAVLTAIERLARATSDLDALARGLLLLSDNAPHPAIKLEMRRRAATLLEQEIGRPERAWAVLFPMWKQTGVAELEEDLGRLAQTMSHTSADAGKKAFDALFSEFERRAADAWMTEEKARLLMKSARLYALFVRDLSRAEEHANAALTLLENDADVEDDKRASVLAEIASWAHLRVVHSTPEESEETATERIVQLRSTLMLEPWRTDILVALEELATRTGASREAALASAILSVSDASRGGARRLVTVDARAIVNEREHLFRDPMTSSGRALLQLLWESALPIFKVTLAQLGVVGTDRVGAHSTSLLGRSVAAALETLPDDTAVFVSQQLGRTSIVPVRTQPPAVIIGHDAPSTDEGALRFLLGRALELAQPAHVLVATFSEEEGRTFFAAVRAAFGPAEEAQIDRDAAAVAAALWRTIPVRNQRDVRELLLDAEDIFDWDKMRSSAFASAARAGLVASGDLEGSIRALLSEHDQLDFTPSLEALGDAIANSSELSALVRFAFSDAFLATLP